MPYSTNWAAILAGGEGQRLRAFTKQFLGEERPKQFCRLFGRHSLLEQSRLRVFRNVEASRTLYAVTRAHAGYYESELADVDVLQRVEQPCNRGTTAAIAYALIRLRTLGAKGALGLFPADHYYRDSDAFERTVAAAYALAETNPHCVILLGAEADRAETEYGWIEPGELMATTRVRSLAGPVTVRSVRQFCEKPSAEHADNLYARRCLWNTLVVIGQITAFEHMLEAAVPDLWEQFVSLGRHESYLDEALAAETLYRDLPASDFSTEVLAPQPERLAVINLPDSGWTDLGHPRRVLDLLGDRVVGHPLEAAAG